MGCRNSSSYHSCVHQKSLKYSPPASCLPALRLALHTTTWACPTSLCPAPKLMRTPFSVFPNSAATHGLRHFHCQVCSLSPPAIAHLSGEGLSHYIAITHSFHPHRQLAGSPLPPHSPSPPCFAPPLRLPSFRMSASPPLTHPPSPSPPGEAEIPALYPLTHQNPFFFGLSLEK